MSGVGDWPSFNQVTLVGQVGKCREFEYANSNYSFTVTLKTKRLMPSGTSYITIVEYHNVLIGGVKNVDRFRDQVREGTILLVQGSLRCRKEKKEDRTLYWWDVYTDLFEVLSQPDSSEPLEIEKVIKRTTKKGFIPRKPKWKASL